MLPIVSNSWYGIAQAFIRGLSVGVLVRQNQLLRFFSVVSADVRYEAGKNGVVDLFRVLTSNLYREIPISSWIYNSQQHSPSRDLTIDLVADRQSSEVIRRLLTWRSGIAHRIFEFVLGITILASFSISTLMIGTGSLESRRWFKFSANFETLQANRITAGHRMCRRNQQIPVVSRMHDRFSRKNMARQVQDVLLPAFFAAFQGKIPI